MKLDMDRLTSRILLQNHSSYKCHFSMAGISRLRNIWAKSKDRIPDLSHSNQKMEQHAKICVSKAQRG